MDAEMIIRPAVDDDLVGIDAIYAHEVMTGVATFDLEPPALAAWQEKLESSRAGDHVLVAENAESGLLGYAYSWPYRPRPAYDATRETSIYLHPAARGRGVGRVLYSALLDAMTESGVHTAVALVALPNPASVALHEKVGFTHVGRMREVGHKFGRWIDVSCYQRMLVTD